MSSIHQPEPWKLTYDDGGAEDPALRDKDGHIVADVFGSANGHRIVACVNACAGISNEMLDAWMNPPEGMFGAPHGPWTHHIRILADSGKKIAQKSEQRLAALKIAEEFITGFEDDETQEGIGEKLAAIRTAITETTS